MKSGLELGKEGGSTTEETVSDGREGQRTGGVARSLRALPGCHLEEGRGQSQESR